MILDWFINIWLVVGCLFGAIIAVIFIMMIIALFRK